MIDFILRGLLEDKTTTAENLFNSGYLYPSIPSMFKNQLDPLTTNKQSSRMDASDLFSLCGVQSKGR